MTKEIPRLDITATNKEWFSIGNGKFRNIGFNAEISIGVSAEDIGTPCLQNEIVEGDIYVLQDTYSSYRFKEV